MRHLLSLCLLLIASTLSARTRTDSLLITELRDMGLKAYPTRDISIYTTGTECFDAMFADIDRAQRKVWVEFMIIANDSIGKLALWHLEQAAGRGVDVRLIDDDYKDFERGYGLRTQHGQDSIRSLGIDFILFDHFHYPWLNHVCRDHRKLVNVDDSIGYIGGLNIADYYVRGNPQRYGAWRDCFIRITGAAVEGINRMIIEHYKRYGGTKPNDFARYLFDQDYERYHATKDDSAQACPVVVYFERSRVTVEKQKETRRAIAAAIDAAQDTLRLVTPYFLPSHNVRHALRCALKRGVHVEILFSQVGDQDFFSCGNYHYAKKLWQRGAHIYLYRGAFHHSKIMMIDGEVSMVGSANLNCRSLKWDYEANSFVFSPEFTHRMDSIFEQDKLQCDTFSLDYYHQHRSWRFRMAGFLVDRVLTPWI